MNEDNITTGTAIAIRSDQEQPPRMGGGQFMVGAAPRALVPVDFDGAWRVANITFKSGMAPKGFKSSEQCMVAILHGLEVGLTPMNALQSIAVINGRPTVWGDGAIGLIRASGLLEYMEEFYENEDKENMKAICIVKRKGEPKPVKSDFSMADANRAGLLGKEGPWQTYPKRMLKMRARWPLRDVFADVLKGLSLREEMEDIERSEAPTMAIEATPAPRRAPPPPTEGAEETKSEETTAAEAQAPDETEKDDAFPGDTPMDGQKPKRTRAPKPPKANAPENSFNAEEWLTSLENAFSSCESTTQLIEAQNKHMTPMKPTVSEDVWQKAVEIVRLTLKRIEDAIDDD